MAGKFLGKWIIFGLGPSVNGSIPVLFGFLSFVDHPWPSMCSPDNWQSPPKTVHVAFIRRDDGQLCLQLNNGKFVGSSPFLSKFILGFVDTLDTAVGITFVGQDMQSLPASFSCQYVTVTADATYTGMSLQVESDPIIGGIIAYDDYESSAPPTSFEMTQVTPAIQSEGDYDGLDFAWVDLTGSSSAFGLNTFRNADLSHCQLANIFFNEVDFSGANLDGANLQGCLAPKCVWRQSNLSNCNLTRADFAGGAPNDECDLTGANLTNANLTNAEFAYCNLSNATLTNCNLTGTDLSSANLSAANLVGSTFAGTMLSAANVVGAIFTGDDLTGASASPLPRFYNTPLSPPSPTNPRTNLVECRLNQSLLGNDWSMLDLTGATILNLSVPLSSKANPLLVRYSILKGLNGGNLSGLSLQHAVFDNAILDGLDFSHTDLTNASFIDASLHGTNLTGAILTGANMTGAQMGSLSRLFSLPLNSQSDLNSGPVDAALVGQFLQNGITLSQSASLTILTTGAVWQLNDAGNKLNYTIRLETNPTDNSQTLGVYSNTTGAILSYAYLPGANLNGASLYGATADHIQFYGSGARLDNTAVLELAKLNDSNLSKVNFADAQLLGANLSNSHLFNAQFNRAHLTPTVNGSIADLTGANLQGADFTDAHLDGADLTNAAVAIDVSPDQISQGGVYLFSLPYNGDTNTATQYVNELNAAAKQFTLPYQNDTNTLQDYVAALNAGQISDFINAFLLQQPFIVLSNSAQIEKVQDADNVWQIVDQPTTYNLWTEVTGQDAQSHDITTLFVEPSLPKLQSAFSKNNYKLRWQAGVTVQTAGSQWLVDNDSENPANTDTGYVKFIIKLNGSELDVYGASLRITRMGANNQMVFDTETCKVTTLAATNMSGDTICPNGTKLSVNQSRSGVNWDDKWLRASALPSPPTCVPTDNSWCSPPQHGTSQTTNPGS
jgi:Uncharacterized low-complexity proteins